MDFDPNKLGRARRLTWFCLASTIFCPLAYAGECAVPGTDGSGAFSGIVNTYWSGTSNPSAGTSSLALGAATGASNTISAGDLLLIIQTQDSEIKDKNNDKYGDDIGGDPGFGYTEINDTGRYEFVRATNTVPLSGGTLNFYPSTTYDYTFEPATGKIGQRTFQIIRVPQYVDFTISGSITAAPWDGVRGGIVAIDVANELNFAGGNLDVSGLGFRGGGGRGSTNGSGDSDDYRTEFSNEANGSKGESTAGTPQLVFESGGVTDTGIDGYPKGSFARGAPGNGGGGGTDGNPDDNDENTGGGGGAGYGHGGRGGHAWCPGGPSVCAQSGGFGGKGIAEFAVDRLTMGGGGGAGTTNNETGIPGNGVASSGAAGGGIVFVRARRIIGSGNILANGTAANQTVDNDGSGGGGAGGAILVDADDTSSAIISASVNGGNGGSNGNSSPHGPGGGGGGGLVAHTATVSGLSPSFTGGTAGVTDGNPAPYDQHYGAESGDPGAVIIVDETNIPGLSSGDDCVIDVEKDFTPNSTTANQPVKLILTLSNPNPDETMTSLSVLDNYPANVENAPTPNVTTSCGGSASASAGGTSVDLSGASLIAGASCTVEVDVIATASGAHINTIPVGDATASIQGQTIANVLEAEDTLTVSEPLTASKTVAIVSDDVPGTATPYSLPGAVMEYTISFTNPGTVPVDTDTIVITDEIPANTIFSNEIISAGNPFSFDSGSPDSGLDMIAADMTYSNDGGATYSYTPIGVSDPNVTHVRARPTGTMAPGTSASVSFRVVIN